ncbi:MAG TPA: folylpolyglutamate synthase/dihydrofolate synthase family protein [Balneolaceae bacterium]|nr:folylpolyglutamate synthase/dihydrofolate synthase family protein [Balneolaceae bacterium]
MNIKTIKEAYSFLESIPKFSDVGIAASDFSLDRFRKFCESIDNPQDQFPSIHVAGSNGKGSTCQILASVYQKAGYKTGCYTSPHLIDLRERFQINNAKIDEADIIEFFNEYEPLIKSMRLTYFEITTALAFWWFAQEQVDIAIIETGLGGRLDATNIITPLVSVITSVTLDHTDILGDTIEAITREKAGIIKTDIPAVIGKLPQEAKIEIKKTASAKKSRIVSIKSLQPELQSGTFSFKRNNNQTEWEVPFRSPVQANNMAIALRVCDLLKDRLPVNEQQMRLGFEHAGQPEQMPGRFEKLHPDRQWYFDGAHNEEAIKSMKEAINRIGKVSDTILILSIMKEKINKKVVKEFLDFKKIVYYTPTTKRGADLAEIERWLPQITSFPADPTVRKQLFDELKNELVIFGGSFYFYPTVKKWTTSYF